MGTVLSTAPTVIHYILLPHQGRLYKQRLSYITENIRTRHWPATCSVTVRHSIPCLSSTAQPIRNLSQHALANKTHGLTWAVTDFFQRKSKCDVNISDSECKYFCIEVKGAVLRTDCKPDPASTSSNNSKSDAVSIRDRESTSLCTEDTCDVLLNDSKSDIATTYIIGTSSSSTVSAKELNLKVITRSKVDPTFIVSGFSNWKKASEKFSYHENSESHKGSEEALLALNQKPRSARLSAPVSKEMEEVQKALITIVSSIKFLTTRGLALRGKQEKEGNLYELLELRGNLIPNETLPLLSLTVVRNSNQDIKKNKYCALVVDETTDNSTKEQISVSLQHVNDDFDIFEDFIGIYETSSTTGDTLAAIIEDVLLRLDLPIEYCRGKCHDCAKI
ncbi:hypothetical protein PR048_026609 [Dryococelus australis]|uniref:DUF4371 domain-containing protein n=1 Tax=Dryococelus australis TaxID=614101 RepID=A0ABQ9GLV8_9NEOP|nr:hypothetical protein PR048_026609 [Dryococelus australis]